MITQWHFLNDTDAEFAIEHEVLITDSVHGHNVCVRLSGEGKISFDYFLH